jgi:hypothetical protein
MLRYKLVSSSGLNVNAGSLSESSSHLFANCFSEPRLSMKHPRSDPVELLRREGRMHPPSYLATSPSSNRYNTINQYHPDIRSCRNMIFPCSRQTNSQVLLT